MKDVEDYTVEEIRSMARDSRWLMYLESAGVDNWQGIEYAIDLAREEGFFDED